MGIKSISKTHTSILWYEVKLLRCKWLGENVSVIQFITIHYYTILFKEEIKEFD